VFEHHTQGVGFDRARSGCEWWANVSHSAKVLRAQDAYGSVAFHWDKDEVLQDRMGIMVRVCSAQVGG
jgi:hypothetical protein